MPKKYFFSDETFVSIQELGYVLRQNEIRLADLISRSSVMHFKDSPDIGFPAIILMNMGKQSRNKKRKEWVKKSPDEVISSGPIRIERYGRFIRFSNNSTDEQHAAFLKETAEAHKQIISDLAKEVPALQEMIKKHDPIELMHRAAYQLLPLFKKYKSESEFSPEESYYLPTVE